MARQAPPSPLLSTAGVAALLGVHPKHVFRLLKRGLPGHRLGGEWRFDSQEVLAWVRTASPASGETSAKRTRPELPPLLAANGDVCVELLLGELTRSTGKAFGLVQADATSGRAFAERGNVLAAGVHGKSAQRRDALLTLHLTRRTICLAFPKGKRLRSLRALAGLRLASRPATAGVRAHLDRALAASGVDSEEVHQAARLYGSHRDVALSVLSGQTDAGVVTLAWAERSGLASLPIAEEDYAMGLQPAALEHALGRDLLRVVQGAQLKRLLAHTPGYEPANAGTLL